jgi:hypothetical protein
VDREKRREERQRGEGERDRVKSEINTMIGILWA